MACTVEREMRGSKERGRSRQVCLAKHLKPPLAFRIPLPVSQWIAQVYFPVVG